MLYKVRILPRSPQRKREILTTETADGSKEKLQKFLCGEQFLQCKNNRAGDENERRTTVDYKTRGAYEVD